jgi:hypothetical protein
MKRKVKKRLVKKENKNENEGDQKDKEACVSSSKIEDERKGDSSVGEEV